MAVAALGKKPRSVNYFGPITAHNKGPGESRNTSSCRGISPSLVQPDGAARDEKARAGSEGGRRFCFYLICPERERERGAMGDELSPRPPFLGTLQDTPRPYPRKVVQSSTLDRADADTRPLPSLFPSSRSSLLHPSHCPPPLLRALLAALFLQRLFTAAGRYISRTTKLLDLHLAILSTRYPDIRLIISGLILACQRTGKVSLRHCPSSQRSTRLFTRTIRAVLLTKNNINQSR